MNNRTNGSGPLSFLILTKFVIGIFSFFRYFLRSSMFVQNGIPLITHVNDVLVAAFCGTYLFCSRILILAFEPKSFSLNILMKLSLPFLSYRIILIPVFR